MADAHGWYWAPEFVVHTGKSALFAGSVHLPCGIPAFHLLSSFRSISLYQMRHFLKTGKTTGQNITEETMLLFAAEISCQSGKRTFGWWHLIQEFLFHSILVRNLVLSWQCAHCFSAMIPVELQVSAPANSQRSLVFLWWENNFVCVESQRTLSSSDELVLPDLFSV